MKSEEISRKIPIKQNDKLSLDNEIKFAKADMIRNNLLSRKDLMNLYKLPVHKCYEP